MKTLHKLNQLTLPQRTLIRISNSLVNPSPKNEGLRNTRSYHRDTNRLCAEGLSLHVYADDYNASPSGAL